MSGRSPYFLRDRKRMRQGGGGGGSTRKSVRAKRRSSKLRVRRGDPASWVEILPPEELLGEVSTFLNLEDVRSLVQTVSSRDQREKIKKKYLHLNFAYIEEAVLTETLFFYGDTMTFSNENVDDWMEANGEDWKDFYDKTESLSPRYARVFDQFFGDIIGAGRLGRVEVVQHLIEQRGANPNEEVLHQVRGDDKPIRPLLLAALRPDLDTLRYLLERNDVDRRFLVRRALGREFAQCVLLHADLEALEIVLERGIDVNAIYGESRETLLMQNCEMTKGLVTTRFGPQEQEWILERMRLLLAYGADPSVRNAYGFRPRDVLEREARYASRLRSGQSVSSVQSVVERNNLPTDQYFADLIALLDENMHEAADEE